MQLNSVVMFIPASSQRRSRKAVINFGSAQNLLQMSGTSNGAKIEAVGKICQKEQGTEIGRVFVELGVLQSIRRMQFTGQHAIVSGSKT